MFNHNKFGNLTHNITHTHNLTHDVTEVDPETDLRISSLEAKINEYPVIFEGINTFGSFTVSPGLGSPGFLGSQWIYTVVGDTMRLTGSFTASITAIWLSRLVSITLNIPIGYKINGTYGTDRYVTCIGSGNFINTPNLYSYNASSCNVLSQNTAQLNYITSNGQNQSAGTGSQIVFNFLIIFDSVEKLI
jgi:hypothetical protein